MALQWLGSVKGSLWPGPEEGLMPGFVQEEPSGLLRHL